MGHDEPTMNVADNPQWWVLKADCYPDDGPAVDIDELFVTAGRAISRGTQETCFTCPVRIPCLKWAFDQDMRSGYFGGVTSSMRRKYDFDQLVAMIRSGKIE